MQSKATTVEAYLAELPPDRRDAIAAVRRVILNNLDSDYEEGMSYGMIGYYVPHSVYPPGYHCTPKLPLPFAGLASQKNHMAVYLMCVYGAGDQESWFREAWSKTGKKLDMGKSCIRFKKLEDIALDVIGEAIRRVPAKAFIEFYETAIRSPDKAAASKKPSAKKSALSKQPAAKKSVGPKKAAGKTAPTKSARAATRGTSKKPKRPA